MTIQIPNRVITISSPEQKVYNEKTFPLILSPASSTEFKSQDDFNSWCVSNTTLLKSLLIEYGVLAFRGFPLKEPIDFSNMVESFGLHKLLISKIFLHSHTSEELRHALSSQETSRQPMKLPLKKRFLSITKWLRFQAILGSTSLF
jgi:hypothetical protein